MSDITDLRIFLASLLRPIIHEAVNESLQNINIPQQAETAQTVALPDLIKIKEAETETGFKKGYIYELVSKKAIPFHKVGNSLRFSRNELRDWVRAGRPAILQEAVESLAAKLLVNRK